MPTRLTISPLDEETLTDLRARYNATNDADLRLRYQMILHAHNYVCKRPTWTLKRRAEEQPYYAGNA